MSPPTTDDLIRALPEAPLGLIERMLERDPGLANARAASGVSAPLLALYHRRRDVAELLLRARPELDVFEAAALMGAANIGDEVSVLLLLALGADPESASDIAAGKGHTKIEQKLRAHS